MLVQTSLAALAAGEQVELGPGDILRVSISFKYTVAQSITVVLWASLGTGLIRSDMESFKEISLEATLTPKTWEGDIDINIPMSGEENVDYWLRAEIEGYPDTQTQTPNNPILIRGMPEPIPIWETVSSLLVLGLMAGMVSMMAPMMEEGFA